MRARAVLAVAVPASATAHWASSQVAGTRDRISVDARTGHLVDGKGRVRIFHGVNVVFKEWPWLPSADRFDVNDSLADVDMANLRDWGFNAIRLGVMWQGVEPGPGEIDHTYLRRAVDLAGQLGNYGIYTLVDLHQDLGSRHFCGEGIPEHYVHALLRNKTSRLSKSLPFPQPGLPLPMKMNETDFPSLEDCLRLPFGVYYLAERVGALFRELYTSGTSLNDGVLRYWSAVAKAFADQDHVVGYELLNEPAAFCLEGSLPSCLDAAPFLGSSFEDKYLAPFYRAIAERIRAVDAKVPIFYEPSPYPKLTGSLPFSEPPLKNDSQQVFAYHIYCPPGDQWGPIADLVCKGAQDIDEKAFFGFLKRFQGTAGFMTEFGAVGQSAGELAHLQRLLAAADATFQNWAYWEFKLFRDFTTQNAAESFYDDKGSLEVGKLRTLSRTYAQAIAGVPTRMVFFPDNATFELDFSLSGATGPTEIYVNKVMHYPTGLKVEVTPVDCLLATWADENHLELTEASSGSTDCASKFRKVRITRPSTPSATFV